MAVNVVRRLSRLAGTALVLAGFPFLPGAGANAQELRELDLGHHWSQGTDVAATLVLLNATTGEIGSYNPDRARRRFIPASTFKIPHTLIALETGVATGPDHLIHWDSTTPSDGGFWAASWSQDHTLRSAVQSSVYWYFQDIAASVGEQRMQRYLDQFDYGNRSTGGGVDQFWLHGQLRISPLEQVFFLQRMYAGHLGVSDRATRILKDILVLEEGHGYRLSGKTGTADVTPSRELAWLVGYVEREEQLWFFALNMEGEDVWERWGSAKARLDLLKSILEEQRILPQLVVGGAAMSSAQLEGPERRARGMNHPHAEGNAQFRCLKRSVDEDV